MKGHLVFLLHFLVLLLSGCSSSKIKCYQCYYIQDEPDSDADCWNKPASKKFEINCPKPADACMTEMDRKNGNYVYRGCCASNKIKASDRLVVKVCKEDLCNKSVDSSVQVQPHKSSSSTKQVSLLVLFVAIFM